MRHQLGFWVAVYLPIVIGVVTALVLALYPEEKKTPRKR